MWLQRIECADQRQCGSDEEMSVLKGAHSRIKDLKEGFRLRQLWSTRAIFGGFFGYCLLLDCYCRCCRFLCCLVSLTNDLECLDLVLELANA